MPILTRERKQNLVFDLGGKLRDVRYLLLADFTGLDALEMMEVRDRLRGMGVECRVIKNTLLRKALKVADLELEEEFLRGPTALIFGYEDPVEPIRATVEISKDKEMPRLKGGWVEGKILWPKDIEVIAFLPPRGELLGQLVGAIGAPFLSLLYLLQAPLFNLLGIIQTLTRRGEGKGGERKVKKEDIIQAIEGMTVVELNELVQALKERFGIEALSAPIAVSPAVAPTPEAAPEEEKMEFDVILTGFGEKKIQVIKAIREIISLGLKEAKEFVESVPKPVKEKISREEAEEIRKKLEEAGATVEVR